MLRDHTRNVGKELTDKLLTMEIIGHMFGDATPNSIVLWIGVKANNDNYSWSTKISFSCKKPSRELWHGFAENEIPKIKELNGGYGAILKPFVLYDDGNNEYNYELTITSKEMVGGNQDGGKKYFKGGKFKTPAKAGEKRDFSVLVSSCQKARNKKGLKTGHGTDPKQPAWKRINDELGNIDMNIMLGDTHYRDDINREKKWEATEAQFGINEYRKFLRNTITYAIYDDHDFISNDQYGATKDNGTAPPGKLLSKRQRAAYYFKELWPIPNFPIKEPKDGTYYKVTYGIVDFYFLDCFYYRDNVQNISFLGSEKNIVNTTTKIRNEQWNWLKDEFGKYKKESSSVKHNVKVLCCGNTLITGGANWIDCKADYEQLQNLLNGISNVLYLSGDVHLLKHNFHATNDKYYSAGRELRSAGFNVLNKNGGNGLNEIISSGIGRVQRTDRTEPSQAWTENTSEKIRCSSLVAAPGGFVKMYFFPEGKNEVIITFHRGKGMKYQPRNFTYELITDADEP